MIFLITLYRVNDNPLLMFFLIFDLAFPLLITQLVISLNYWADF